MKVIRSENNILEGVSVIMVVYKLYDSAYRNLLNILNKFEDSGVQLVIIDNSPGINSKYFEENLNNVIRKMNKVELTIIRNSTNNRFVAYNLGIELANRRYTVIRSDDDFFHEHLTKDYIGRLDQKDYGFSAIAFDHIYDGYRHRVRTEERPIETVLFKTASLKNAPRMDTNESADWRFLRSYFRMGKCDFVDEVLMDKALHGRSLCA